MKTKKLWFKVRSAEAETNVVANGVTIHACVMSYPNDAGEQDVVQAFAAGQWHHFVEVRHHVA